MLGGWQTNALFAFQSGFPFNVIVNGDTANTGRANQRPNLIGAASSTCGSGSLVNCINASAFQAASFAYGNFGRNVLYGPGLYNIDFSAFKNFSIHERATVQFRSEFFNLLNTPALSNPNSDASPTRTSAPSPPLKRQSPDPICAETVILSSRAKHSELSLSFFGKRRSRRDLLREAVCWGLPAACLRALSAAPSYPAAHQPQPVFGALRSDRRRPIINARGHIHHHHRLPDRCRK